MRAALLLGCVTAGFFILAACSSDDSGDGGQAGAAGSAAGAGGGTAGSGGGTAGAGGGTAGSGGGDAGSAGNGTGGGASGQGGNGGGNGGTGQGGAPCTPTDPGDPCDVCANNSCCTELTACDEDTNPASGVCSDVLDCVGTCLETGDLATCIGTCNTDNNPELTAVFDCIGAQCASQC